MSAKIATALHEVMSKVGYVQKTGKNQFHGYRYAGEADLLEKLRPAMVEAGLLLIPSAKSASAPDQHGNINVEIEYTLVHKDGDVWPEKIIALGCGNDMSPKTQRIGDKGLYKALTGANKYLLFKLFQIETGDDPEQDEHQAAPPAAAQAEPQREQKPRDTHPAPPPPQRDANSISSRAAAQRGSAPQRQADPTPFDENPFQPSAEEITAYVARFRTDIEACETNIEIDNHLRAESQRRFELGIGEGTAAYEDIKRVVVKRRKAIAQMSTDLLAAE